MTSSVPAQCHNPSDTFSCPNIIRQTLGEEILDADEIQIGRDLTIVSEGNIITNEIELCQTGYLLCNRFFSLRPALAREPLQPLPDFCA